MSGVQEEARASAHEQFWPLREGQTFIRNNRDIVTVTQIMRSLQGQTKEELTALAAVFGESSKRQ